MFYVWSHARHRCPVRRFAPLGRRRGGQCHRRSGPRWRGGRAGAAQRPGAGLQARARPRRGDRGTFARLPARPLRDVLEHRLPELPGRARRQRDAEERAPGGLSLRLLRARQRGGARRHGGGQLHGQPARPAHRRPRPGEPRLLGLPAPDLLQLGRRAARARRLRGACRQGHAGDGRARGRRADDPGAAAAERVRHRLRRRHPYGQPRGDRRRADARAARSRHGLRQRPDHGRPLDVPAGTAAAVARQPLQAAGPAGDLHPRRRACRSLGPESPLSDRQAAAQQPDLPRHLPHRHARHRPAAQDHEPDLPVHRPQGIDRALRAGRRPRRLRSGAGAFPHSERDRRLRERGRGEDHRGCRHGDLSDARPGALCRAAHAPVHAADERAARRPKT